jgi:hypothetical protein
VYSFIFPMVCRDLDDIVYLFVLCLCKISKVSYVQTLRPTVFIKWNTDTP